MFSSPGGYTTVNDHFRPDIDACLWLAHSALNAAVRWRAAGRVHSVEGPLHAQVTFTVLQACILCLGVSRRWGAGTVPRTAFPGTCSFLGSQDARPEAELNVPASSPSFRLPCTQQAPPPWVVCWVFSSAFVVLAALQLMRPRDSAG